MINPTSLPTVHIQNGGLMQWTAAQLFLRSDRLRYGQLDTGACYHKHAAIASHIPSRGKKRPEFNSVVSQSIRPNSSVGVGLVNKYVMHDLLTTAVDAYMVHIKVLSKVA